MRRVRILACEMSQSSIVIPRLSNAQSKLHQYNVSGVEPFSEAPSNDHPNFLEVNRATYIMTRMALRPFLGKTACDAFMDKIWPGNYNLPIPLLNSMPSLLRRRWNWYYWTRVFEYSQERTVEKYAKSIHGSLFIDVGANVGWYCKLLRNNFKQQIAVEADPQIYQYLRNHCPPNCEALNLAVSDREGTVSFHSAGDKSESFGLGTILPSNLSGKEITVPSSTLSRIASSAADIDLIKVDVEGAEWLVLDGAESIMSRVKCWIIELHDHSRKNELENRMQRYGYESQWLDSRHALFLEE